MREIDYGLDRAIEGVERGDVLAQACRTVVEVRRKNADRQEPALGDDNVSLAAQNYRNIINLLERQFEGRVAVRPMRPRNSFQLIVGGYTINVYAVAAADPEAITWSSSGIKQGLASANSALVGDGDHQILSLDDALFEDGGNAEPPISANRLVLVHWADADAAQVRLWIGFPRNNSAGGSPWLQVCEITGRYTDGERGTRRSNRPAEGRGPFGAGPVPDVPIQWRPGAEDEQTGDDTSHGA
jgi:hypothetical protein